MNITILIIIFIWMIISRIANSEMDTILHAQKRILPRKKYVRKFLSLFISDIDKWIKDWYLANNYKPDPKWNCCGINIKKTILSFTLDSWHMWKAIMVFSTSILISIMIIQNIGANISLWYSLPLSLIVYGILGFYFEIFYYDDIGV